MTRKEKIQRAVLAALGCVEIDYSSPLKMDQAASTIADFVEGALYESASPPSLFKGEGGE